jgi:hypothetical protein
MSHAAETYHHWRVFTPLNEGVCIELKKRQLVGSLLSHKRVRWGNVRYFWLEDLEAFRGSMDDLPFIKRQGFRAEAEWRMIVPSKSIKEQSFPVPLSVEWINRVVVNPWIPTALFEAIRDAIHRLSGCKEVRVTQSSLIDNSRWKTAGDEVKARFDGDQRVQMRLRRWSRH